MGAKLWNMVFPYFDDGCIDDVIRWMPAHKGAQEAAQLRDSRGQPLTENDVKVNAMVDELAKAAVEEHRVPVEVRREVGRKRALVRMVALGVGLAAREANEVNGDGRDAATFTTERRGMGKDKGMRKQRAVRSDRTVQLGGHNLKKSEGGWECVVCGRASKHRHRLAHEMCAGNRALKWAQRARRLAGSGGGGGD